ncbi:hypothetical protein HY374_01690 [Candidatus Berkelbacteria bacterium]|nr:hypothetical protein [Candidatus Berkelbacteria bacterium]
MMREGTIERPPQPDYPEYVRLSRLVSRHENPANIPVIAQATFEQVAREANLSEEDQRHDYLASMQYDEHSPELIGGETTFTQLQRMFGRELATFLQNRNVQRLRASIHRLRDDLEPTIDETGDEVRAEELIAELTFQKGL